MGEVRVATRIDAEPEAVWRVLADIDGWGAWNDVMVDGRSSGGPGASIRVKIAIGPIWFPVASRLHTWEPGRALVWGEDRGALLSIDHGFWLSPEDGGCRVVHFERFEGVIGRLVLPLIRRSLTRNYGAFLDALEARVRSGAAAAG